MGKYIELHLHLDGAITVDIAKKLAKLQKIVLPGTTDEELEKILTVPEDCNSLNDFLDCFGLPLALMQTRKGISEAVRLVAENIKSQGVIYAEIRFAPQLHTRKGLTQEEVVLAALEGMKRSELKSNLILCCMRGEGNEPDNEETLKVAKRYLVKDGGVVAVDLAGAEGVYPSSLYEGLFRKAAEMEIPFTIHAGEAGSADSVRSAIQYGASRIGHGVRIFEDPEVVEMIRLKEIPLEMCPTSNRITKAISDMSSYPLMDYLKKGIKVTVNTDDMGIENITLADEFEYLKDSFGLTDEQEKDILKNSIEAAFTTDKVKGELKKELGL